MSEFKVIKCKKCDAPLVELIGEKLDRCIQCGANWGMPNKTNTVFNTQKPSKYCL